MIQRYNGIEPDDGGVYVMHSDYAALERQLAEAQAEVERLREKAEALDTLHRYRWDVGWIGVDRGQEWICGDSQQPAIGAASTPWEAIQHAEEHVDD